MLQSSSHLSFPATLRHHCSPFGCPPHVTPSGPAVPDTEIRIVDPQDHRLELQDGQQGLIMAKGCAPVPGQCQPAALMCSWLRPGLLSGCHRRVSTADQLSHELQAGMLWWHRWDACVPPTDMVHTVPTNPALRCPRCRPLQPSSDAWLPQQCEGQPEGVPPGPAHWLAGHRCAARCWWSCAMDGLLSPPARCSRGADACS